jgi:WD40 repeat protein
VTVILLASKADDGLVTIWNTKDWKQLFSFSDAIGHNYWPPETAFNPRRPILATFGEDNTTLRIWAIDAAALRGEQPDILSIPYTTVKIVLVGDSGVGKTGLGWRLAHGEFKEHSSTHGQQFWVIPQLGVTRADGLKASNQALAALTPYQTEHINRFGSYTVNFSRIPEPLPPNLGKSAATESRGRLCSTESPV